MVDAEYIKEQTAFIKSLTDWERYLLESYTSTGFFFVTQINVETPTEEMLDRAMSMIQRMIASEEMKLPVYSMMFYPTKLKDIKREDIKQLAFDYGTRLYHIFKKAPKLKYPIKLFRGLRDKFDETKQGLVISSTYRTDWKDFSKFLGKDCCLLELTMYPGIQTILVTPDISAQRALNWEQYEIMFLSVDVNMKCDNKEIRKQQIEGKLISVFECGVTPKDYDFSKPLMGKPAKLGGKTRRLRKVRKTRRSKNRLARR